MNTVSPTSAKLTYVAELLWEADSVSQHSLPIQRQVDMATRGFNEASAFIARIYLLDISGDVAQLVRALPCHGRGRGFEPRRPRHRF
jgi:hypothetical protein